MLYELERNSRLLVVTEGGFMGRLDVIDITLDLLSDKDFLYLKEKLEFISKIPLENYDFCEDSSYRIAVGENSALQQNLHDVFSCEKSMPCPFEVISFYTALHKAAKPEHRVLKP